MGWRSHFNPFVYLEAIAYYLVHALSLLSCYAFVILVVYIPKSSNAYLLVRGFVCFRMKNLFDLDLEIQMQQHVNPAYYKMFPVVLFIPSYSIWPCLVTSTNTFAGR
jgi:hypothetical protein